MSVRPAHLGALEMAEGYAAGRLSPVEVTTDVLQVVEEREPELNAFWVRDGPEEVLARARASTVPSAAASAVPAKSFRPSRSICQPVTTWSTSGSTRPVSDSASSLAW